MAEGYKNKKLLVVAIIMGVVFVVLYNVQRLREESARNARRTFVALVTSDLEAGAILTEQNVQPVALAVDANIKGLVLWDGEAGLRNRLGVQTVGRKVEKNSLLQFADIGAADSQDRGNSVKVRPGWQAVVLPVENSDMPSAYVRRGDRVDVYGKVAIPGKPLQMQLILEAAEVMAVGQQVENTSAGRQDFRTVSIQLPNDIVPQFVQVLGDRVVGRLKLAVRNPEFYERDIKYPYGRNPKDGGTIAKPVLESLSQPLPVKAAEDVVAR